MEEALRVIYGKVETIHELKQTIERLVAPIKNDENFHIIAEQVIPEDLRKGPMGHEFLKYLLGEKLADKLHIQDRSLDYMRVGEGI